MNIKNKIYYFLYRSLINKLDSKNTASDFVVRIRLLLLKGVFKKTGKQVNIQKGVVFRQPSNISIDDNSGIGMNSIIYADGDIHIGKDVMIGPEIMILTSNHDYNKSGIMRLNGNVLKSVIIEDNVWIGARVIILPGAHIQSGTVVGAGSVVNGILDGNSVYAGVPAKKIKTRAS